MATFFLDDSAVVESVSDCNANCNHNTLKTKGDIKDIDKGNEDTNCRNQAPASQQNITGTNYMLSKVCKINVI